MKRIAFLIIPVFFAIISTNSSYAQDFKKIVEIVVGLETSLKQLIAKESAQREADVAVIKEEVHQLQNQLENFNSSDSKNSNEDYEALSTRLGLLENSVKNINNNPEFTSLTGQLNQLITELKQVIEKSKNTPPPQEALFNIKVGILAQAQAQVIQEATTAVQDANPNYSAHWQRQLFVRRVRVILSGDVAKKTTFFFESDAPNIGKLNSQGAKDTKFYMFIQDAYVQHTFSPEVSILGGLQLVGITRNGLQSAASLLAVDYGSYQFLTSTALDNFAGRDFGVNLRGFLFDERLEFRGGLFSGKSISLYSPLRFASRFNYSFHDKEKGIFYPGTTLGKGDILSVGAGFDAQGTYKAFSFDGFSDMPLGDIGSLTASASLSFLNGGGSDTDSTIFTGTIPKQSIFFAELGYFFKDVNFQPYLKFESRNVNATVLKQVGATASTFDFQNKLRSSWRLGVGLNYFITGHNANIKLLYEFVQMNRAALTAGQTESKTTGMLTIQFQYFTL